ncbi:UDP-glycosyltransferase 72B1-like [Carex rostrata]
MKSTTYMVEELVRKTRVLLYQGIYDLQDGMVSTEAWMRQMNWDGSGHLVAVDKGSSAQTMIDHQPSGSVLSRQHFLWAIRSRSGASNATLLPEGFIERNNEVGLVRQSLIPQMEIVGNTSTGGFLTHCGWNSVLERIMSGVPMITWPLYAEQKINVKLLVNRIAVVLKPEERTESMQGEGGRDARKKALQFKMAGGKALSEDGSSFKDFCKMESSIIM